MPVATVFLLRIPHPILYIPPAVRILPNMRPWPFRSNASSWRLSLENVHNREGRLLTVPAFL